MPQAAFSFGTGKVGDLAGFASALILSVVAPGIAIELGSGVLLEPRQVALTEATVVAAIGLVVNIISALVLSGGHHHGGRDHHHGYDHRHAGQQHDNNLRAPLSTSSPTH